MSKFFLSHASAHKPFCNELRTLLVEAGHSAWLDAYDLHGGESIASTISDGIYDSDYFVLLVSPEVHGSAWVPWELSLASYREVQLLRRVFVIPAMRVRTELPRLVAHKSYIDAQGDAPAAATRLLTAVGGPAPADSLRLPAGATRLVARLVPPSGKKFSPRKLEDAFWAATVGGAGRWRSFPLANRFAGISLASSRVVVGWQQQDRDSVSVVEEDGSVTVTETGYSGNATPHLQTAEVVMKAALFVQFAFTFAQALGLTGAVELSLSVHGLDQPFALGFDPSELMQFRFPPGNLRLAPGEALLASHSLAIHAGNLEPGEMLAAVDELQADLFHPVRFPADFALGTPASSLRLNPEAVRRHVVAGLKMAVFQG